MLLLPYLGEGELFAKIHVDEPWDSEHNLSVAEDVDAEWFQCPSDTEGADGDVFRYKMIKGHRIPVTNYVMITGENSVGDGCKMADIIDGTSNTFMIVEVTGGDCPAWCEPVDLDIGDWHNGINNPSGRPGIRSNHTASEGDGANVAFCDGSVRFLPATTPTAELERGGDRRDGEPVDFWSY